MSPSKTDLRVLALTSALLWTGSMVPAQVAQYGQCGGSGYTGSTACVSPYVCVYSNAFYSQCLATTGTTTTTKSISTTKASTTTTKSNATTTKAATTTTKATTTTTKATTTQSTTKAAATTASGSCTINSLSDVAAVVKACTNINVNSFTVPGGSTFDLELLSGTTVNILGKITFGVSNWAGPLFQIAGTNVHFNGNGNVFDGQGASYWDGQGGNGPVPKPKFMKIKSSGVFTNLEILNSPVHVFSISNTGPITISKITVDDSAGDKANSLSGSSAAGHNTDGFDVSGSNILIDSCVVKNQDDCLAINKGSNITFSNNNCSGGHGISIGSIASSVTVSDINILNNVVSNSDNGLRIKTQAAATGSAVSSVTYTGNTLSTIHKYGVLIDESYPNTLGTPGKGVVVSNVEFTSGNTVSVDSGAVRAAVNCGSGACTGTWNWSGLKVSGGKAGAINYSGVTNFTP